MAAARVDRSVYILGPTGAGKSSTNNSLTGLPPAQTKEQEKQQNFGLKVSAELASCSSEVIAKGPIAVTFAPPALADSDGDARRHRYNLQAIDTPGVPDTEGKAVTYLDTIFNRMKADAPPHGIVFVVDANGKFEADLEYALRAAKECFNNMLGESRLVVYVNKLNTEGQYRREGVRDLEEIQRRRQRKTEEVTQYVAKFLVPHLSNFSNSVPCVFDSDEGVEALKFAIAQFPSVPMNVQEFKTWSEVGEYNQAMVTKSICAEDVQKGLVNNKKAQLDEKKNDVEWHTNRIRDLEIAIPITAACGAVGSFFSFGIAAAGAAVAVAGMTAAVADSKGKLPVLQSALEGFTRELRELQTNLQQIYEEERRRCQEVKNKFDELETEISRAHGPADS